MIPAMLRALLFVFCLLPGLLHAAAPQEGYHHFSRGSRSSGLFALLNPGQHIDAWFFSAAQFRLCVLDEGDAAPRYGTLEAALRAEGCVAGINGGYFGADEARTPLGLLRHKGRQLSPLATGSFAVAGVLYDTGRDIRLERSRKLSLPPARMQEAIQGGPFLVEHGRKISGLNATKRARRSFVATDGQGTWCLGMSSPMTLEELAVWLASGRALGNFRVYTALNMDGGTSSAFRVAAPPVHKPGVKAVRNYIGIMPRPVGAGRGAAPARRARRK